MVTGPPGATPVTSPVDDTAATALLLVVHVTTRPVSPSPAGSLGVAVSCPVAATPTVAVAGATITDATGTTTVNAAVPLRPSLVAVRVTGPPAASPVTSPVDETVATAILLVVHVTTRPVTTFPLAPFLLALTCPVAPPPLLAAA